MLYDILLLIFYYNKRQNTAETMTESPIKIQQQYPPFTYILLPIFTAYCGIFVAVSNHFILKSKIQSFLLKALISSNLIRELVIDLLSSMSFITYSLSACLLTIPSDAPLTILTIYDLFWLTLCMAIVAYQKTPCEQKVCSIMVSKNLIFLGLCYINVIYHYFSQTKLISMPLSFLGLYIINLLLNAYENRFKNFVLELLGMTSEPQIKSIPKCINKMEDCQTLANLYPVSQQQIEQKIQVMQQKSGKRVMGKTGLNNQLDTKVIVRMKLLEIALCIHLSHKKMQQDQIRQVKQYYGCLNGTIRKRSKNKTIFQQNLQKLKGNTYNQRIKLKEDSVREEDYTNNNLIIKNIYGYQSDESEMKCNNQNQPSSENFNEIAANSALQTETSSILFCIFPVRLFESSKIISNIFSVFINLGFGFLLNYSINITSTLKYGGYFNILHALLFLPYIPRISTIEYLHTMTLSSIWKYGILGTILTISIGTMSGDNLTIQWKFNPVLQYQYIVLLTVLVIISVGLVALNNALTYRILAAIFCLSLITDCGIEYLRVSPLNI